MCNTFFAATVLPCIELGRGGRSKLEEGLAPFLEEAGFVWEDVEEALGSIESLEALQEALQDPMGFLKGLLPADILDMPGEVTEGTGKSPAVWITADVHAAQNPARASKSV